MAVELAGAYSRSAVFFNPHNCTVAVYDQVYNASTSVPSLDSTLVNSVGNPVGMRIIEARSVNRLFVQKVNSSSVEQLVDLTSLGPTYFAGATCSLFTSDAMKSGTAMRAGSGGTWEGAFSEPHLSKVHWWTGIPWLR